MPIRLSGTLNDLTFRYAQRHRAGAVILTSNTASRRRLKDGEVGKALASRGREKRDAVFVSGHRWIFTGIVLLRNLPPLWIRFG